MSNGFSMKKYPMATKALQEQDGLFKFLMSPGTPDETKELQKSIAAIIDNDAIGGPKQKDAMLTMAILMLTPEYIFDEPSRFEKDYNKSVQKLVNDSMSRDIDAKPSAALSQVIMAVFIASTETNASQGINQMLFDDVYGAQQELDEVAASFALYKKHGKNPVLSARVDDSISKANQLLAQRLQQLEFNPLDAIAGRAIDLLQDLTTAFEKVVGAEPGEIFGDLPKSPQPKKPGR